MFSCNLNFNKNIENKQKQTPNLVLEEKSAIKIEEINKMEMVEEVGVDIGAGTLLFVEDKQLTM